MKTILKLSYDFGLEVDGYYVPARDVLFDECYDACTDRNLDLEKLTDLELYEVLIEYLSLPRHIEVDIEDIRLLDCIDFTYASFLGDKTRGYYAEYEIEVIDDFHN